MASSEFIGTFLLNKYAMVDLLLELYHVYAFEVHKVAGLLFAAPILFPNATRQSTVGLLLQPEDLSSYQLFQYLRRAHRG
jgi:hypothetical protein